MSRQKIYIKEDSKEKAIRKLEQIISESAKKVLNETKWIGPDDEPIDGSDYDSIDNPSQNNLPPIDRYHPDYWYYRQEEEPYDPTYDDGYLDDYTVNNDNEFKDDLDDWGIEENKQYNKNRNMKRTIKLRESELKRIISESVKSILESEMPILHSEGNGEVYRDDAFVTDWRDNPNDDPNKIKAPYNSYVWNKNFSKHYPTPESFWNPKDTRAYKYTRDLDKMHKEEDKFKKSEDLKTQRALHAADSRPLHRKGSLNRAMDESINRKINRIVSESVKRVLNEYGDTISGIKDIHRSSKFPSKYKRWGDEDDEDDELEGLTY